MKIAVYGASGYTGRLVLAELARRGIPAILVGRSPEQLRVAAADAGVTVVPGVNDDGLPGSLIAHQAAERVAPVSELVIALDLT